MQDVNRLSQAPRYKSSDDAIHVVFATIRHYIGRLACHIRAPKQLIDDSRRLNFLLDRYEVRTVANSQATPRPQATARTTLTGIVRRMVASSNYAFADYEEATIDMDRKHGILERVIRQYNDPNFSPEVHAEIQVL